MNNIVATCSGNARELKFGSQKQIVWARQYFSSCPATYNYIPPQVSTEIALATLHDQIHKHYAQTLQLWHHLTEVMPNVFQHIAWPIRGGNLLDQCNTQFKIKMFLLNLILLLSPLYWNTEKPHNPVCNKGLIWWYVCLNQAASYKFRIVVNAAKQCYS